MSAVLKNDRGDIFVTFKDGNEYTHAVALDQPVRIVRLTPDQEVNLRPALLHGKPYSVALAARRLLAFGEKVGITERARAALIELIKHADPSKPSSANVVADARAIADDAKPVELERRVRGSAS